MLVNVSIENEKEVSNWNIGIYSINVIYIKENI